MLKWLLRAVALFVTLLVVGFLVAGLLPVKEDPVVAEAQWGVGASSVEPSSSGLEREFPPMPIPDGSPASPEQEELGRLLFFDPVLSVENDISCATCHHPDLGFADGRALAMGAGGRGVGAARSGGKVLNRNTPSLWNVGYRQSLFWDGRADSLEAQALTPLAHVDEMGASPDQLVEELRAIPEYVERFDRAFDGDGEAVTIENVTRALAAFQRTLVSRNSAFDRYAAGDESALTAAQRRGLTLFRSAATRCFECHALPTFASETFRVLGVPESPGSPPDVGRSAVAKDAPPGAFRVPSLRNVALTAPYMHNGSLESLEEVVDFYAEGGGRTQGTANVDPFVLGFELDAQERSDLIAFLYALTDESALPEVPATVPSGLPVVARLENPARAVAESLTAPSGGSGQPSRPPTTIVVEQGESIQAAVDRAQPGDVVEVPYGVYHERVVIDINNLTLRGVPNEAGEWPVLDGRMVLADGVIASGNNFLIERLTMKNYTGNGLLVEGVRGVTIRDVRSENTGIYGIYPVQSDDVLIERVVATGARDAGIYVGQSRGIVIRDSEASGNVIGIEVENSVDVEVYRNYAHGNTVGLFFDLLPQLTSKVGQNYRAYENRLIDNNLENFADEDMIAALLPPGVGLLVLATDEGEIYNNEIRGNATAGIAVFSLGIGFDPDEINVGPTPERNYIHDNQLSNNGYAPAALVRELGIGGADILWDGSGWSNRFDQPGVSSFPPILPGSNWPDIARRGYWRLLDFVINTLAG